MTKFMLLGFFAILFSCANENISIQKKLNNDILSSNFDELDRVFEKNRPITAFYLDSVIKNKPSFYFSDARSYFNQGYSLYDEGNSYSGQIHNYLYSYKSKSGERFITIKYSFFNNKWTLKEIVLSDPFDKI